MNELLEYFGGDELPANVFEEKYKAKGEKTPDDMHKRMAGEFSKVVDMSEKEIYELFKDFRYIIPQGSVMATLGIEGEKTSLSNCFVIGQPEDSYGGIFYKDQELAQLMKRRGGVGIDISTLRPSESKVNNAAGTSTGASSFMERFSNTTREVAQSGRRGALLITMDIRHPDIENFIEMKKDETKVTGANVSVRVTDEFMKAVRADKEFTLRFPIDSKEPKYIKPINARELWNKIIECARETGDPGLLFIDRARKYSLADHYEGFETVTCNPCGEITLSEYGSCRLLATNLTSLVDDPFTKKASLNKERAYNIFYKAQVLTDGLVDLELESVGSIIKKINKDKESDDTKRTEMDLWLNILKKGLQGRRTGTGVTGLADLLASLGIQYGSKDSIGITKEIFAIKLGAELDASIDLAKKNGAFDMFNADKEREIADNNSDSMLSMIKKEFPKKFERMMKYGRRNISLSTVAPTGSLSLLAGTSSGLEPVFSLYHTRRRKITDKEEPDFVDKVGDKWKEYNVVHPGFQKFLNNKGKDLNKDDIEEYIKKSPYSNSTAPEVEPKNRIKVQKEIQKYTTHSISSTINLDEDVKTESVGMIYMMAWKEGLKGVTIYREGSKSGVLLSKSFYRTNAPERPKTLEGHTYKVKAKGIDWIVVIGIMEDHPYEVFAYKSNGYDPEHKGKYNITKKGRNNFVLHGDKEDLGNISDKITGAEAIVTRLASGMLRHGASVKFVASELKKCKEDITSFSNAISRTLSKYDFSKKKCSDCGSDNIEHVEGCNTCKDCGSSKC